MENKELSMMGILNSKDEIQKEVVVELAPHKRYQIRKMVVAHNSFLNNVLSPAEKDIYFNYMQNKNK